VFLVQISALHIKIYCSTLLLVSCFHVAVVNHVALMSFVIDL